MIKRIEHILQLMFAILLLSSCATSKKMVYLHGATNLDEESQIVTNDYEFKIKPDDILEITVSSKEPELLSPFANTQLLGQASGQSNGSQNRRGLTVDKDGYVELPILGRFKAGGLSRFEFADIVKQKLIKEDYIKNPTVVVRFLNSHILVLGAVKSPGVKELSGERITILDAIGMSGDLLTTGKRTNILVIREEDGERKSYTVNLTSASDVLTSPVYYLQQNDIVYVEPNKNQNVEGSSGLKYLSAIGTVVATLASLISLGLIITKL